MMKLLCAFLGLKAAAGLSVAPDGHHPAAPLDPCHGITCQQVECKAPFVVVAAADSGMCCDMCDSDKVEVEDRSWTKDLTGGVPMNNNADKILCRDVVCLKPQCEEFDQIFDGRCCTKCSTTAIVTQADIAAKYPKN